jgi:predicted ribosomally synthesized peptide with SipW-like signal peptide
MKMKKKVTNFVLNLHRKINSLYRTNEGGRTIRKSRIKKFKKKGKRLIFLAQIVAIWYLLILTSSYLTTDTGAYFNDVEKISGTISVSEDWCKDVENGSDFWHKYCKDNAGIGNGPDTPDEDTGDHTDPDNPGHNKGGCDDHTNAPCTEVTEIKETHTSNSITLTWVIPSKNSKDISFVKIYRDGNKTPVGNNLKEGSFADENLKPSTKYSYKITTIDKSGNESSGLPIQVTTSEEEINEESKDESKEESKEESNEEIEEKLPVNVTDLTGTRNGNSPNIELSWKNPAGISHVRIYIDSESTPIEDNVKGENIKLISEGEVTYIVTTVDNSGNESIGETITVK